MIGNISLSMTQICIMWRSNDKGLENKCSHTFGELVEKAQAIRSTYYEAGETICCGQLLHMQLKCIYSFCHTAKPIEYRFDTDRKCNVSVTNRCRMYF